MEEPRPSLRKTWTLQSMKRVSPGAERWLGRFAFALFWVPLLISVLPVILEGTPLRPFVKPLGDAVSSMFGYTCAGSTLAALALLTMAGGRMGRSGIVGVDSRSLYVIQQGKERRIPRGLITEGMVRPGAAHELELHLSSGEILQMGFSAEGADDAQAVLEALDLGPEKRRVAITLGEPGSHAWRKVMGAGCALLVGTFSGIAAVAFTIMANSDTALAIVGRSWVFVVLGLTLFVLRSVRYTEIIVGAEGLVVKEPWSTKFIHYAGLRAVDIDNGKLVLRRVGRRDVVVTGASSSAIDAAALRVNEAMERARRTEPVERTDWLDRRGRSLANWRASVIAALRPAGGYRAPAHAPDDALRILADPRARAEQRIGAALALVGSGEKGAEEKVRIAAEACANDKLRIALSQVTGEEPDHAAIEAAFAAEAEESESAAKPARTST